MSDLVCNGNIDVLISERYFGDPILSQRLLGNYRLSLVYPAQWGEAPPARNIVDWIRGRPFVTHEPGQTLRNLAFDFLDLNGISVEPLISASSSVSVKRCIDGGFGFGILPSWCVGPGDTRVVSAELDGIASVQVYFGMASFLQDNAAVRDLHADCQLEFSRMGSVPAEDEMSP